MASGNALPSGEGAPGYYERQFGDRVRRVNKGGGSGRGWGGGVGVAIAIVFVLSRFLSRMSSPHYEPPPAMPPVLLQPRGQDDFARIQKQMEDALPKAMNVRDFPGPDADDPSFLTEDEVPLLTGLCYRIHRESLQKQETPGKQVCRLLDDKALPLLRHAASGVAFVADQRDELLEALNGVIDNPKLDAAEPFRAVKVPLEVVLLRQRRAQGNLPDADVRRLNRALLEATYPAQIVPARFKGKLNPQTREGLRLNARNDLAEARRFFEGH
jgi:hypothetical protein